MGVDEGCGLVRGSFAPAARRRPTFILSGANNVAFWHLTLSVSTVKTAQQSLTQQPLHLTSLYNVASVETEEGFKQSRPVAVLLPKTSAL